MLSTMIAAACLAASTSYAAPAPVEDGDAVYAKILKLRAAGKSYEASKILWPAAERLPGHVAIQAAYADEAIPEGEEFPLVGCTTGDLDYSPGGERMACVAVDAKGPETNEIILYDLATRKKVPLEIAGQGASWSPDGQRIAYVWRGRQLRVLELKTAQVTAYDIGHERDHLLPYPVDGGTGTRWSADGRFIHCRLGAAKGKTRRGLFGVRGESTSLIVDRRDKVAWTRPGPLHDFEWAPKGPSSF